MESKQYLEIALLAGEIMLYNGGETYRIENTVYHILKVGKFQSIKCYATLTYIVVTVTKKDQLPITMITYISDSTGHLTRVSLVNEFSREFTNNKISYEDAMERLNVIKNYDCVKFTPKIIAYGFLCFGANLLIKSHFLTAIYCFTIGIILGIIIHFLESIKVNDSLIKIIGGFSVGFIASILNRYTINESYYLQEIVLSSIIPMVPGISLTNALRDIMDFHYIAGISRTINAVLIATCIAIGIISSYKIFSLIFGGVILY